MGQPRFYDFLVFSEHERVEKLRYMHRNPVKRGLVLEPEQWLWSSSRHYAYAEVGPVIVNEPQKAELRSEKSLDAGSRNAQTSKTAKSGAAGLVAVLASLGQPADCFR